MPRAPCTCSHSYGNEHGVHLLSLEVSDHVVDAFPVECSVATLTGSIDTKSSSGVSSVAMGEVQRATFLRET
jgi:hypothetical protein